MEPTSRPTPGRPSVSRDGALTITGSAYRLRFEPDRPYAALEDASGQRWLDLCLAAGADRDGQPDATDGLGEPGVAEDRDAVTVTLPLLGGVWDAKRLVFECRPACVLLRLELEGSGALGDLGLLGGPYAGHLRWGSGTFLSGARFAGVFNPEPFGSERRVFPAAESTAVDAVGTSLPGKAHWFATPAPLFLGLTRHAPGAGGVPNPGSVGADQGGAPLLEAGPSVPAPDPGAGEDIGPWLGLGLLAGEGEQNFTGLHYDATEGSFRLRLPFEGFTRVQGRFSTPALAFTFGAPDPYAALDDYHALLRSEGKAAASPAAPAAWWSRPMFCGWGAQCEESGLRPGSRAPELARQDLYDRWLAWLEARDLTPGTVVLDDKWQATYGQNEPDPAKWPDLKGWIAGRHAAGQKVLLWWKAWDPEGLDPALCVTNSLGAPVSADPTSRAYEAALRASVRAMLGADGLNANGFKVDFTGRTPSGAHLRRAPDSDGTAWGLGLLHRLLFVLRDEAKRVKPDALVVTHTPNAAFGDVTDMIRLNDVNTGADVVAQMRHRARVARSALPETPIDTDNWPMPSRAAWRDYVNVQASLGVPALYFADRVCGEETTDEDVEAVRACWNAAERGGRP